MDLSFSAEETTFRDELRAWLEANLAGEGPRGDEDALFEFRKGWQRTLYDAGWAAVHWPQEYGGRDASLMQSAIQAHGGIGFTWEADVHWFYKRAQLDANMFGDSSFHNQRLIRIAQQNL